MDRSPGGQCTICNHPQRVEIDKALVAGVSYRAIASQYGVSPRSEAWRTILKHRTDEERRGRPATYRNIPGTPPPEYAAYYP